MLRRLLFGAGVNVADIALPAFVMTIVVQVARRSGTRKSQMIPAVSVLTITHALEVLVWSFAYLLVDAAPADANLVYFAFVNHTTPGYGDVVPVERWRLLGPMMAMNGVLLFGWSKAVIFEMLRKHWSVSKFPNRRPRSWHPCMQREDPKPTDALGVTRNAVSLHRISCPPIDALHSIGDDLATAARRSKSR
jgi:hypothetical protein